MRSRHSDLDTCRELREQLHAYRAGEGAPLWRVKIETHLDHCTACRGELWLQSELEDAAKQGPPPLGDGRKRELLAGIHAQIQTGRRPQTEARRWSLRLGLVFAPLAAAALLLLTLWPSPPTPSVAVATEGWLQTDLGVEAFAPDPALVRFVVEQGRPVLYLQEQAVLVHFKRPSGAPPLEVRAPGVTAIVWGTVFFVDARKGRVEVGVQRGKVEVRGVGDDVVFVAAGQQARGDDTGLSLVDADSPHFVMLDQLFPRPAEPRQPPPRMVASRRPKKKAAPPILTNARDISRVVSRRAWLVQECYEHQLKVDSSLAGSVEVELSYGPDGQVREARLSKDELGSDPVRDCVLARVSRWRFPSHDAGVVTVRIPFVFTLAPARDGK